jgi:hypothetical protein
MQLHITASHMLPERCRCPCLKPGTTTQPSPPGIRSDKLKAEKAAQGGKKTAKKASLNVGKGGAAAGGLRSNACCEARATWVRRS